MLKKHFINNQFWIWTGIETVMAGLAFLLGSLQLNDNLPMSIRLFDSDAYSIFLIVLGSLVVVNVLWDFYWHYIRAILLMLVSGAWFTLALSISLSDFAFSAPRVTLLSMFCWIVFIKCCISLWLHPSYKLKGGKVDEP